MLFAIGAGPQVVAVSSFDEFPAEVKALPEGRRAARSRHRAHPRAAAGPRRSSTARSRTCTRSSNARASGPSATGTVESQRRSRRFASSGRPRAIRQEAEALASSLQARLDAVRERVKGRAQPRTLLVFERQPGDPARASTPAAAWASCTTCSSIAGGQNVFADVQRESVQPSIETTARTRAGRHPRSARHRAASRRTSAARTRLVVDALVGAGRQEPARPSAHRRLPRRSRPAGWRWRLRRSRTHFIPRRSNEDPAFVELGQGQRVGAARSATNASRAPSAHC